MNRILCTVIFHKYMKKFLCWIMTNINVLYKNVMPLIFLLFSLDHQMWMSEYTVKADYFNVYVNKFTSV